MHRAHLYTAAIACIATAGIIYIMIYSFTPTQTETHNTNTEKNCMELYRFTCGDYQVTAVCDGHINIPADNLLTIDAAGKQHKFTAPHQRKTVDVPINIYIITTDAHLIVVDSGLAGVDNTNTGRLMSCLHKAGYTQEQVDAVLITHTHYDHVSGLLTHDGKPAFPNATIYISARERDGQSMLAPYEKMGKLHRFSDHEQVLPGVTALETPGHTQGHASYLFESAGKKLLVWGDLLHRVDVQFDNPRVALEFDSNPQQAIATRLAILQKVSKEHIIVAGAHITFPGVGYIEQKSDSAGYQWNPL